MYLKRFVLSSPMQSYLDLVSRILEKGERKPNRTGIDTLAIAGAMIEHDMSTGFPLLTTKQMAFKSVRVELEGFIKGITDKRWYQERKCHIWDEWCNPQKVPYAHDEQTKQKMLEERDLGPIYGFQWRHFGALYESYDSNYVRQGMDQLATIVEILKRNPQDRRMVVSAWNPLDLPCMALPPCHYSFQVTVINQKLNLLWNQRSVDTMLGLPFNIASYALLLHLLAKESNLAEGKLIAFLGDVHIYENQISGAQEQLQRKPYPLPSIDTKKFTSIFEWEYYQTKVLNYESHPAIQFPLAV